MLTSVALILLLGLLFGSIFSKMRLPSLLGMIIVGILLSPHALNLIDESILSISADLRQIALVIILTRAGLSLSESFMSNTNAPKDYNQLHINPLYDVMNKLHVSCIIQPQPKVDEIGALAFMLSWYGFDEKTLIVADRGYESYNTFAHFMERGSNAKFLIRVKQNKSAMREIAKLPMTELDTDVSFTITTTQTKEDKENNYILVQKRKNADKAYSAKTKNARWEYPSPYPMTFRVVRFKLNTGEYETLTTNLSKDFTLQEINVKFLQQNSRSVCIYALNLMTRC